MFRKGLKLIISFALPVLLIAQNETVEIRNIDFNRIEVVLTEIDLFVLGISYFMLSVMCG